MIADLAERQKYTEEISGDVFRKKVEIRLFTQKSMPWGKSCAGSPPIRRGNDTGLMRSTGSRPSACARTSGARKRATSRRGRSPKPMTTVRVTGIVARRRHRQGEAAAVVGQRRPALRRVRRAGDASFDAARRTDFRDGGDARFVPRRGLQRRARDGRAVEWSNRITLESRDYLDGDERRVEIQAAPPAAVRYATGGSARLGGGACERESIRGGRMKAALDDPAVPQRVLQGGRPPAEWTKGEPGRRLDGPVVRRRGCSQARLDLDAGGDCFHRRPPGPCFGGRVPYCCATTHGDGLALLTVRPR